MPKMLSRRARRWVYLFCGTVVLAFALPARADPKPLTKDEQARVDKAIDKGVAFLKRSQLKTGDWPQKMYKEIHLVGQCALPAYALLEAGVATDDPVIQKAADYIRPRVITNDRTYELALAILFFDRLGDPKDKKLIRTLALRLLAGQHHTGGWAYCCPVLNGADEQALLAALQSLSKEMRDSGKTREQALADMAVPPMLQSLPAFRSARSLQWPEPRRTPDAVREWSRGVSLTARTDNSNTQFAILGLWAAQRNGVPMEPTFDLLVGRFERSQDYPSGSWWYSIDDAAGSHSPSMICVGLKGLAIGRGLKLATPGAPGGGQKDVHVLKGLAALSRRISHSTGRMDTPKLLPDYYFLWSLERVAMLYNLETINEKDWFRWGAEALVTNQAKNGAWTASASTHTDYNKKRPVSYKPTLNTAFALLFLKRAHPMKDLTPKLPFTASELNEGIAQLRPRDKFPLRPATAPAESRSHDGIMKTPTGGAKH